MSSNASLTKLIDKTSKNGVNAEEGSIGEIIVMEVSIAVNRKKQLK